MAISVTNWVWNRSRSRHGARLVLLFIADSMRTDGGWAWPSNKQIAERAAITDRAVQTAITELVKLGELEVAYNEGPKGCNRYRVLMSHTPEETSPPKDLHPAEDAPPKDFPEDASPQADGRNPEETSPPEDVSGVKISTPAPEESAPGTVKNRKRSSSKKNVSDDREDVSRICAHLADRIEANGSKRPNITQAWRTETRLLLDADKRTEEQVHTAIDWCQGNAFWCSKVMSMPKLRDKYDTLRLEAIRERDEANGRRNGGGKRHQPYRNPEDDSAYEESI